MRLDLILFVICAVTLLVAFALPIPSHIRGMVISLQLLQYIQEVSPEKHRELVSIGGLPIYNYFAFMRFLHSQELDEQSKIKQLKQECIFYVSRRNRFALISLLIVLILMFISSLIAALALV